MAEVLVEFSEAISDELGNLYTARAWGGKMSGGMWEGWIEFTPSGSGRPVISGRETTQPNETDTVYWATGLSQVYLEGALRRAIDLTGR